MSCAQIVASCLRSIASCDAVLCCRLKVRALRSSQIDQATRITNESKCFLLFLHTARLDWFHQSTKLRSVPVGLMLCQSNPCRIMNQTSRLKLYNLRAGGRWILDVGCRRCSRHCPASCAFSSAPASSSDHGLLTTGKTYIFQAPQFFFCSTFAPGRYSMLPYEKTPCKLRPWSSTQEAFSVRH